nr:hypothetical protein [Tanacetum cinerariifolium]
MLLYIKGNENGKLLVDLVLNGHFKYGTVILLGTQTTPATVKDKTYEELTNAEKIHEACDIKATNIVLQGLPQDIYNLERESKMYDEFDMFTSVPKETIHSYYLSLNKAMAFISITFASRYPPTNNQLRTSSTQRIKQLYKMEELLSRQLREGKIRGKSSGARSNATTLGVNKTRGTNTAGQAKVIWCYNYQEKGHMARQCSKPKRPRNSTWFKEKVMLAEALELGVVLDEEQMAFLADNGDTHDALYVIDYEETLELAEESRVKMHAKQNDPIAKEKKVNIAHIDYVALNKLSKHFVKNFVPKKQLSAEQAFWLRILKPVSEIPSVQPEPALKEIPCELPTINLVKDSFNRMRNHVNYFENVVTVRTKLIISPDLVHTAVNSVAEMIDYQSMEKSFLDEYSECVKLKAELSKKNEKNNQPQTKQDALEFPTFFEINELKAHLKAKYNSNSKLKDHIATLKGKRVISSTSSSGSKPPGNRKKNRISQSTSSNKKNKVEDHLRSIKPSLNKKNRVSEPVCNANVTHFVLNASSKLICATCNKCMFDAIHDLCVLDYVNDVNVRVKSKSIKSKKKKVWKPTGKVFTNVGYIWKPTGQIFTIDGNTCPLTRITSSIVVPPKKTLSTTVVKKFRPVVTIQENLRI